MTGFEPAASWSQTKRDTKLRHIPVYLIFSFASGQNCGQMLFLREIAISEMP